MLRDETVRDVFGGVVVGLAVFVVGLFAWRGELSGQFLFSATGLILLGAALVGGGGMGSLFRKYLGAR